jgi:arylsulfatase A-like enzyme
MPFLIKGPGIKPGSICDDIISNVDFAPTWLEAAGVRVPSYMQGESFLDSLRGTAKQSPDAVAYHRYWMHAEKNHNAYVSSTNPLCSSGPDGECIEATRRPTTVSETAVTR